MPLYVSFVNADLLGCTWATANTTCHVYVVYVYVYISHLLFVVVNGWWHSAHPILQIQYTLNVRSSTNKHFQYQHISHIITVYTYVVSDTAELIICHRRQTNIHTCNVFFSIENYTSLFDGVIICMQIVVSIETTINIKGKWERSW